MPATERDRIQFYLALIDQIVSQCLEEATDEEAIRAFRDLRARFRGSRTYLHDRGE